MEIEKLSIDVYKRQARGTAIINLLQLTPGENITAVIPIREYKVGRYLLSLIHI